MRIRIILFVAFVTAFGVTGCVRMPTQSTQVVDDRPRLTFDPVTIQGKPSAYELIVDGISYGPISQYLVNRNTLPIVAGRHQIMVLKDGRTVLDEVVVLGENTTRVIRVADGE